jgi:hypothetical protein
MASKKSKKKKSTRKSAGSKSKPAKKLTGKRPASKKSASKKSAKRASAPKKSSAKKKSLRKTVRGKTAAVRSPRQFSRDRSEPRSGEESGDLQGLSDVESADSESVDELIEEGNAFEAGVVSGVEDAGKGGVREVHTREVPEDDVPGEYLDEE